MALMPVVGPQAAATLQAFYDHPEPPLADRDWIENQIAVLRTKPSRAMTATDGAMLVETFVSVLKSYPKVDLGYAVGRLLRESKWFPDVSEIVKLAEYPAAMRAFKKLQAWKLIQKHKTNWREPIPESDRPSPEDIARIKSEVEAEFAARNPNKKGREE